LFYRTGKIDEFVKSPTTVIPANAGIPNCLNLLDSGFRRYDDKTGNQTFYEFIKITGFNPLF